MSIHIEANEHSADPRMGANTLICFCKHSDLFDQSRLTMFMLFRRFTERFLFSLFTVFCTKTRDCLSISVVLFRYKRFTGRVTNKWRKMTIGNRRRIRWLTKLDSRKCKGLYFLKNDLKRW